VPRVVFPRPRGKAYKNGAFADVGKLATDFSGKGF
jgi:hypothetical protein